MSRTQLALVVASSLALASGAWAADIRLLSSWDKTNPAVGKLVEPFAKGVETATQGKIKFIVSGPETVPPFEQLQPASTGVFQMLFTHGIYHYGTTGLAVGMDAGRGSIEARRKSGMVEVLDRHYQKHGLKLVGLALSNERLPHRAASAGRGRRGSARAKNSRDAELPCRHQHAGRFAGRPAGRRGLCGAGKRRCRRRGLAWVRRAPRALVQVAKYMLRPTFGLITTCC